MRTSYRLKSRLRILLFLQSLSLFVTGQITTFQKIYPATYSQSARDVVPTPDGGYLIAGETEKSTPGDSDLFMIKTNSFGDTLWTKQYGGSQPEYPHFLLPTTDGNYFVLAYTKSYGAGDYDVWLLKMDPNGDTLWTKTYGGTGDDMGKEMILTSDGNYVMVGRSSINGNYNAWLKKITPAGAVLWTKYYGGAQYETARSVKQCLDGGFILTGQTFRNGNGDIYVVKTNATGDTSWTKSFGGAAIDDGNWILANADGSYVLTAETTSFGAGDFDVEVMKLSGSGTIIWNKFYGGTLKDISKTIQHTSDGGYVVAAISRSFGWVNPDMWLVKLDAQGDTMWTRHYGSWDHEHCYAVKQTADGGYIALGHTRSYGPVIKIMFIKLDLNGGITSNDEIASDNNMHVYPNPTNGMITVDFPGTEIGEVTVSNALGQQVYTSVIDPTGSDDQKTIHLENYDPGYYFVTLHTFTGTSTRKIILSK